MRLVVLITFFASGFIALSNEVLWGRMLILCQGTSIYAFSSMLAVVLTGIGVGSLLMGRYVDGMKQPMVQLARVQLGIAFATFAALHLFGYFGDFPKPSLQYGTDLKWLIFAPLFLLGPMALLWGATFPLCVRCYSHAIGRAGRDVSLLYVANTVGSILGAVAAGFWLIGRWGVSTSTMGLAVVSAIIGTLLLVSQSSHFRFRFVDVLLVLICAVAWLGVGDPYFRVIEARIKSIYQGNSNIYEHIEETAGTTTAFGLRLAPIDQQYKGLNTLRRLWVNGHGMTTMCTETKLMAHLPVALVDNPKDLLVICFGMGTTVRSASLYDDLNISAVELLPGVIQCFKHFYLDGPAILQRPNVNAYVDDGRNYLLMHDQQYDVITIDPAPPFFSAGTVNLYTREFFELVKSRLRKGGVLCLWIPPGNKIEVRMVVRTFLDVFKHTDVWSGPIYKGLYLIGSQHSIENVEEKIRRFYENPRLVQDLTEWEQSCSEPEKVLKLFVSHGDDVRKLFANVPMVTDDHPYTEFPLLRVINEHEPPLLNSVSLRKDLDLMRASD